MSKCDCDFRVTPRLGNLTKCSCGGVVNLMHVSLSTGKVAPPGCSDPVAMSDGSVGREAAHEQVSADVAKVKDHLAANRTTEREAADIHEAARRSLVDHAAAKGLRKIG